MGGDFLFKLNYSKFDYKVIFKKDGCILDIIKSRLKHLAMAGGFGLFITIFLFFIKVYENEGYEDPLFILMLLILPVLFILFILGYRKYKDAVLILENEILHIQVAKIEQKTSKSTAYALTANGIEVCISCFGVMLDSKIIKFNRDKITLNSVEIRQDSISFVYGSEGVSERLTILHGVLNKEQILSIVNRFRYETGVVPRVLDYYD